MIGFVIWAAVCAAGAALFLAVPLLRARGGTAPAERGAGAAASLLIILSAFLLYPLWSHHPWGAVPAASNESIEPLLTATVQHPEDISGWLDLGQAYLKIEQWPLARRCFQHADHLAHGTSAAALSGLGETILFQSGGNEATEATELFNRALQLDPRSPQALFYTGITLLNAGDLANARARFATMRELGPPPAVVDALDKQIAAIDVQIARQRPDPATAIHVHVDLAPALAGQVPAGALLFVFVRSPQGGPPLAVKRLAATFPQQVDLSSVDAVIASHTVTAGQKVQVMARLSAAGTPTGSPGDLYGEISAVAGRAGERKLLVDRHSP
jgi:cytochrome c-type biogenesis protein CcmH